MTENATFDYVVVGGGTAGAIVAARLSEDPDVSVCLFEAGPSDVGFDDVLQLRRWLSLLEGPIDLAYTTTLQPRGNAHIVHSRAAVLGGCSSHNTQIFFKPMPGDWQDWVDRGAARQPRERPGGVGHDRLGHCPGRAGDHRQRRIDRYAAAAAAVRHRPGRRPARARNRRPARFAGRR